MIFISIIFPILLLIFAAWFIGKNYRGYLVNWNNELSFRKIIHYGIPVIIKSLFMLMIIIFIHNYFHSDHKLELFLFVVIYFVVAILQSSYSIGGFVSRLKFVRDYSLRMFRKKSQEAEDFKNKIIDKAFDRYSIAIKILIIVAFLTVFIPNISVFILSNVLYFLMIISFLILSLLLNNVVYFGLVSLMIFQYDPVMISFLEVNYIILFLSFLTIVAGMIIETRLDNRMVKIVASRMIKSLNFNKGYTVVYQSKGIIVYQNVITLHYFVYYRFNGIVIVFESLFDAKLSRFVVKKMITKGSQYLKAYGEV